MPLKPGKRNVGSNIRELHKGPEYKRNLGKKKADEIAVAAAESASRRGKKRGR